MCNSDSESVFDRRVRRRTQDPLQHVPFTVVHAVLAFVFGNDINWTKCIEVAGSRSLYAAIRAYYLATTCSIENRGLITPTINTEEISVATFYDHLYDKQRLPVFGHLLWLVGRNVCKVRQNLLDDARLYSEVRTLRRETELRNRLDDQSYAAAKAVRKRINQLLRPHVLPPHAQEVHVRQLLNRSRASYEVTHWLQWLRRYGEHVAFGRVCLSVHCRENHFCSGARERKSEGTIVHVGDPADVILPREVWKLVVAFLSYDIPALAALGGACRTFHGLVEEHPLSSVVKHFRTASMLEALTAGRLALRHAQHMTWQAPCSQTYDPYSQLLREVLQAYRSYATAFTGMRHAHLQNPPAERDSLVRTFVEHARAFPDTGRPVQEKLLKTLRTLYHRLLDIFAVDVLDLEEHAVHALPPRAFCEGSKHRKGFRREFTEPTPDATHRGAQVLHMMQCMREDLRQGRAALLRSIRSVEAFEVAHTQRLMDELRDSGLVSEDILHPCAQLTASCNAFLTHPELNDITQQLVSAAEQDYNGWASAHAAVRKVRHLIADRITGLSATLLHGLQPIRHPCDFKNWLTYLSKLSSERTGRSVSMRLVTAMHESRIEAGFSVYYEDRVPSGGSIARPDLTAALPLHCLAVHGHKDKWPPRSTVADADVLVVWGGEGQVVLLVQHKAWGVLDAFLKSEEDIVGTLKRHGQLTGKCAPCGRPLRHKDIWIGSTCVGHLPE